VLDASWGEEAWTKDSVK